MSKIIQMLHLILLLSVIVSFNLSFGRLITSKYSNLERLSELKKKYLYQVANPIDYPDKKNITLYNTCIQAELDKNDNPNIFGPFYLFAVEGIPITLQCGHCPLPNRHPVVWSKLTFENRQIQVKKTDGKTLDTDYLPDLVAGELSTYFCSWALENRTEMVANIWTVEVVTAKELEKVTPRNHKDELPYINEGLTVKHYWSEWSDCNKCDKVGKRHKLGNCLVEPNLLSPSEETWQALQVYSSLSCTLFLNLHPEIGQISQELTQNLAISHKIMIGFCKSPCEFFNFKPEEKFLQQYPDLHFRSLYKSHGAGNGSLDEGEGSANGSWRVNTAQVIRGLAQIPITTDFIPEMFAITCLLGLQLYILIKVCKNKSKAK